MSKIKDSSRGAKKQQADLYQRENKKHAEKCKRHQELLRQKDDLEWKVQILKKISESIIHSSVSYPNGQGRQFKQYQTSMINHPQLSDNRHAHRSCSPKFQINTTRPDDTSENTHTYVNNCESAAGMKPVHCRKIFDKQLPPYGRNVPQQKGDHTFGGTGEQKCSDNSHNSHICPRSANSSSGNERRHIAMSTGGVNLGYNHEDGGLAPKNQAMTMPSGSVAQPGYSFEMNHTQDVTLVPTNQAMTMPSGSVAQPRYSFEMNHTQDVTLVPTNQAMTMPSGSVAQPGYSFEMNHTQDVTLVPTNQAMTMPSGSVAQPGYSFEMNHTQDVTLVPTNQAMTMPSGSVAQPGYSFEMNHTQDVTVVPTNQAMTMPSGSVAQPGYSFEMNHTQDVTLVPTNQAMTMPSGSVAQPGYSFEMNHTQDVTVVPTNQAMTMPSGSVAQPGYSFEMNHTQDVTLVPTNQAMTMSSGSVAQPGYSFEMNHTQDVTLVPTNQAMTMPSGSVAQPGYSFEMNHTQNDVLEYLQDSSSHFVLFAPRGLNSLDDVMDTIGKDNQPLNSRSQDQDNLPSIRTSYSVSNSSSRAAAVHYRRNTGGRNHIVVTPQACIKPHTTKSKAKIIAHTEDDVVEKGHAKQELVGADSVHVLRQKVECLTIEDMRK